MARPEKVAAVKAIQEQLSKGQGVVLTDYRGLTVAQDAQLRRRLREAGVEYRVIKNTLARRAAAAAALTGVDEYLTGPTAIAVSYEDPVAPAKVLNDFAKERKELEIKGGLLNGQVIDAERVKALADLPSREQLLAQVFAGMQAPVTGFVNVLAGNLRNLVYALDAVRRQKEETNA